MITAVIELVLVFACYLCGKSSMEEDAAEEEKTRQQMISENYQVPNWSENLWEINMNKVHKKLIEFTF